ncbi:nucleotide exchange factor GrpE [Buchnera aphidicola (Mollitrichosiphum nigrofasciatum)]|uniref:nucleotide exchange factor GrpE n=1 Tax=Buchnera aphidicola TaxID=9 RepID=UPI0031B88E37
MENKNINVNKNLNNKKTMDILEIITKKIANIKKKYIQEKTDLKLNFKKIKNRLNKELENTYKFSLEKKITDFLPIIDSIDQAVILGKKNSKHNILDKKILYLSKLFKLFLRDMNVNIINKKNIPFNPDLHAAISIQISKDFPENTVLFIMQNGYILNNRLLRPAMVVVSKK